MRNRESAKDPKHHPSAGLYLVIHGHFYQPPRENPWLGTVDRQPSAAPHHDWNERIAAQCYGPNRASRILDGYGRISDLVSNYEYLSFNFGPTLMGWLAAQQPPATYRALQAADQLSARRLGGHGNAIGQVYNHVIMPLADALDRRTQVLWGQADFEHHFGRPAEGMWLAETAIDGPTARELVAAGIRFTVLSPLQARRARRPHRSEWFDVSGGKIDPTRAYRTFPFPHDRSRYLDVFFYDGPLARGVAFEHILRNADLFADRLAGAARPDPARPVLINVATDGESYGHHEPFGDMCLAYLFNRKLPQTKLTPSNYAHFLSLAPPEWEVELFEPSAWSCAHGVGRWQSHCGCSAGTPGYDQKWRRPLREGLEHLRDELRSVFVGEAGRMFEDPWAARDGYIRLMLENHAPAARDAFFASHPGRAADAADRAKLLRLLESQKYAMFMFTSCAWFFDDISGIEPVQNLRYALRAIELAQPWARRDLKAVLETYLRKARANHSGVRDGAEVLNRYAASVRAGPEQIAAAYALEAAFLPPHSRTSYPEWAPVAVVLEPPVAPFLVQAVGEPGPWERGHPGHVAVRELPTGEILGFEVLVVEGHGGQAGCLVAPLPGAAGEGQALRETLVAASPHERAALLGSRFGEGYYRLDHLPGDVGERLRQRLLANSLAPLADRLEDELRRYAPLLQALQHEGRARPALLATLGRAVTEERLDRLGDALDTLEPEEFLSRIEETYLLAGLADVTPDAHAIGGPLSALFLSLVEQAATSWRAGLFARIVMIDHRIRAVLGLAEAREIPIDRSLAEETLHRALKEDADALENALGSTGEAQRAAEVMLALAERVNLSPRAFGVARPAPVTATRRSAGGGRP